LDILKRPSVPTLNAPRELGAEQAAHLVAQGRDLMAPALNAEGIQEIPEAVAELDNRVPGPHNLGNEVQR
jgi:hypothetical protein